MVCTLNENYHMKVTVRVRSNHSLRVIQIDELTHMLVYSSVIKHEAEYDIRLQNGFTFRFAFSPGTAQVQ